MSSNSEKDFPALAEAVDLKDLNFDNNEIQPSQKTPEERQEALAAALEVDPGTQPLSARALYVGNFPSGSGRAYLLI